MFTNFSLVFYMEQKTLPLEKDKIISKFKNVFFNVLYGTENILKVFSKK